MLKTKTTIKLLEENRRTLKSLSDAISIDEDIAEVLERILSQARYKDKRARSLDLEDFLSLLSDFHESGIHFAA